MAQYTSVVLLAFVGRVVGCGSNQPGRGGHKGEEEEAVGRVGVRIHQNFLLIINSFHPKPYTETPRTGIPCVHPICSPRDGGGVWFAWPVVVVVLQRLPPLASLVVSLHHHEAASKHILSQAQHTGSPHIPTPSPSPPAPTARLASSWVASGVVLDAACSARRASVQQSHQQPSHRSSSSISTAAALQASWTHASASTPLPLQTHRMATPIGGPPVQDVPPPGGYPKVRPMADSLPPPYPLPSFCHILLSASLPSSTSSLPTTSSA